MNKKTLYIITLEPIEQRYTKQWYHYWKKEFGNYFNVKYIDALYKGDTIKKGRFLDINQTNIYKAQQVEVMGNLFNKNKIKDGDIFFFSDGWNFGITALKYMAQLNSIDIKIYTYLHAGTWDSHDFITQAGLREWALLNEAGWLQACDGHFVATNFHKELIVDYFNEHSFDDKIHVVGFPMDWQKEIDKLNIKPVEKKNIVVFPHRLDEEKQPQVFDDLKKQMPEYTFIKTMDKKLNKKEYYELLNHSKIIFSSSLQETFGIGTVEAMMLGCFPVVPDSLSYKELYDKHFRYGSISGAEFLIRYYMTHKRNTLLDRNRKRIIKQSLESIKKMSKVMLNE